jgi:hypothetical protein
VGYFNRFNRRIPSLPRLAHILTNLVGRDNPMEAQPVWDRFKRCDTDVMDADDVIPRERDWFRRLVGQVLKQRGAKRFLAKYPRLSLRLSWLDAIFPGALFIHMTRDWRAVVNSTVRRKIKREQRGGGWFGVHIPGWRDLEGISHEVAAARQFRVVTQTLEQAATHFEGRFFQVCYEALCSDVAATLRRLAEQCDLPWYSGFSSTLPTELKSANYKWREQFDESVLESIHEENRTFFLRYERD